MILTAASELTPNSNSRLVYLPDHVGIHLDHYLISGPNHSKLEVIANKPQALTSDVILLLCKGQWHGAAAGIPLLDGYAEQGIRAYSFSYRGQGESTKGKSKFFTLGHDCQDTRAMLEHITEKHPGCPIVVAGHSYGGYVAQTALIKNYLPEVQGIILMNSISPSGSFKSNLKFAALAGVPALPIYLSATGALPPELAKLVLFNVSGVPADWRSDAARRIPNMQTLFGISDYDCETLRLRYPGRIISIISDQDKLVTWSKKDFERLGITEGDQVLIPGDHEALYTQQTRTVVDISSCFIHTMPKRLQED